MGLQQRKVMHDGEYFPHYYLCTYLPKGAGGDLLSQSLIHFKSGKSPHQQAWIGCAANELKGVPELKDAYVIRALGHDERISDPVRHEPISRLTTKISNAVHGTYLPNFLEKSREIKKLSSLTKAEREMQVRNAYRFTPPGRNPKHVLIVDDILTTGSTACAIIAAVLKACPSVSISIFTLAYTDLSRNTNDAVSLKSNGYAWQPNAGWMVAAEDSPEYGRSLERLQQCILSDSFQ